MKCDEKKLHGICGVPWHFSTASLPQDHPTSEKTGMMGKHLVRRVEITL
jgi:hypothetical protein